MFLKNIGLVARVSFLSRLIFLSDISFECS